MVAKFDRILSIETSCDDTSVAIVEKDGKVVLQVSANQDLVHAPFGGVVPEIASRNHSAHLLLLIEKIFEKSKLSWKNIDGIAVTNRPGLVGSLLVGLVTAKTLALAKQLPFIGINHLEGHILAPFLSDQERAPVEFFGYPFVALTISGGHTSLYNVTEAGRYHLLGQTIDDAAGEAFDKFAKMAGLGYPGGVHVDSKAKLGNTEAFKFPRALIKEENCNFSFSGLKTAAQRILNKMSSKEIAANIEDLCASYQQAIIDVLIVKLNRAVRLKDAKNAVITGGVSANSGLRAQGQQWAEKNGVQLIVPPLRYCTDNAAMIGYAGITRLNRGERSPQTLGPSPRSLDGDFLMDLKV